MKARLARVLEPRLTVYAVVACDDRGRIRHHALFTDEAEAQANYQDTRLLYPRPGQVSFAIRTVR